MALNMGRKGGVSCKNGLKLSSAGVWPKLCLPFLYVIPRILEHKDIQLRRAGFGWGGRD